MRSLSRACTALAVVLALQAVAQPALCADQLAHQSSALQAEPRSPAASGWLLGSAEPLDNTDTITLEGSATAWGFWGVEEAAEAALLRGIQDVAARAAESDPAVSAALAGVDLPAALGLPAPRLTGSSESSKLDAVLHLPGYQRTYVGSADGDAPERAAALLRLRGDSDVASARGLERSQTEWVMAPGTRFELRAGFATTRRLVYLAGGQGGNSGPEGVLQEMADYEIFVNLTWLALVCVVAWLALLTIYLVQEFDDSEEGAEDAEQRSSRDELSAPFLVVKSG